ncbi:hypothetical protein DPEC_G00025970 [Dallia pectoralis]|uniref:Uncharacterized protein n=1 Tax=Dallia pectoralis TaxID=75939 RepID=A0ACC2HHH2_DALPE|nr:hypothetical protein DPEC_G00025970 [Dallia pectoralis]
MNRTTTTSFNWKPTVELAESLVTRDTGKVVHLTDRCVPNESHGSGESRALITAAHLICNDYKMAGQWDGDEGTALHGIGPAARDRE